MSDSAAPSEPKIERPKGRKRLSWVWLMPLIAIAVALALIWREYSGRGPLVEITFRNAEGLKEGDTDIRFRDVQVGKVESLRFSEDLKNVIASARMSPEIAEYIDTDAQFWIVRPEISASGISGLETVLSGVYIEAEWDGQPGISQHSFIGRTSPPLTPAGTPGKRVRLLAKDGGSLDVGAPIFYRRVQVGRVESKRLTDDDSGVEFEIFVNAPHDKRLTEATRFWNVSGIDVNIGADGAHIKIASLSSLIQGGAAFQDLSDGTAPEVRKRHAYTLFPSEKDARTENFEVDPSQRLLLDAYFEGSVRGLKIGAPVEYRGIRVGAVSSVNADVDLDKVEFRTRTTLALSPRLLGLETGNTAEALKFMRDAVGQGLRAQLAVSNLLTGALMVRFLDVPNAEPAEIETVEGHPDSIPTIKSDVDQLAGSVEGVLKRVEQLPVEEVLTNFTVLLKNVNTLLESDGVRAAPDKALEALNSLDQFLSSPAFQKAPENADALMSSLRDVLTSSDFIDTRKNIAKLMANAANMAQAASEEGLANQASGAIAALRKRLDDPELAALIAQLNSGAEAATNLLNSPSVVEAPAEFNATLASLRTLLEDPGVAAAPRELSETLAAARRILEDLEREGVAKSLSSSLNAASDLLNDPSIKRLSGEAADAAAALRQRLDDPSLKNMITSLDQAVSAAAVFLSNPELANTPQAVNEALDAARRALNSPGLREAPEELAATLRSAREMLEDLQRQNAAQELSGALSAARKLLDDPALRRLANEAASTAAALREVLKAPGMQELPSSASDALSSAARLLDRIREDQLSARAAEAFNSVRSAADAVKQGVSGAPALIAQLQQTAKRLDELLVSVDVGSELNYETVTTIREIRDAARAITDLADLVERRPNALILGK